MDGIYLAGVASGPKDVPETITTAKAAAARAAILMANRKMKSEAITAVVDEELCIGCGLCEELCPYGAPRVEEGKSKIVDVLCRGCGVCAAECPRRAITMRHYSDQQFLAQVEAAIVPEGLEVREYNGGSTTEKAEFEPTIVAFCCNWCAYAGADLAGTSRFNIQQM